jgi:hypothetical protein
MHHLLHLLGDIGVIHLALDKAFQAHKTKQKSSTNLTPQEKKKKTKKKKNPLHTNKAPPHKIFKPRQQGGK